MHRWFDRRTAVLLPRACVPVDVFGQELHRTPLEVTKLEAGGVRSADDDSDFLLPCQE